MLIRPIELGCVNQWALSGPAVTCIGELTLKSFAHEKALQKAFLLLLQATLNRLWQGLWEKNRARSSPWRSWSHGARGSHVWNNIPGNYGLWRQGWNRRRSEGGFNGPPSGLVGVTHSDQRLET